MIKKNNRKTKQRSKLNYLKSKQGIAVVSVELRYAEYKFDFYQLISASISFM